MLTDTDTNVRDVIMTFWSYLKLTERSKGEAQELIIIAVDNYSDELAQLAENLSERYPGSTVKTFYDPLMAIDFCFDHVLDILFTELYMPTLDGYKLVEVFRDRYPEVAVHYMIGSTKNRRVKLIGHPLPDASTYQKPVTLEMLRKGTAGQ